MFYKSTSFCFQRSVCKESLMSDNLGLLDFAIALIEFCS